MTDGVALLPLLDARSVLQASRAEFRKRTSSSLCYTVGYFLGGLCRFLPPHKSVIYRDFLLYAIWRLDAITYGDCGYQCVQYLSVERRYVGIPQHPLREVLYALAAVVVAFQH